MQILPDVYWIDGKSSNLYLCVDEDGLTLIDTGSPRRQELVFKTIREIGCQPSDLIRILITHADIDHAGSAAVLQAETAATIYASAATAGFLRRGETPKHLPWPVQVVLNRFMGYTPVAPDAIETVEEGDILPVLGGLHVLATPGHTPDHHAFFSPTHGVLFAGDALNTRGGRIQSTPRLITADEKAARRSAIRLLQLTPAVVACGHGQPMGHHSAEDLMALFNELRYE
ncbi:MAG TPA: MBL fold metallo-hydrolase [Anaerolineae bacterium]